MTKFVDAGAAGEWNHLGGPAVHKVTIVRAPDGGQLRGQITGAKTVRTVSYPSKKMQCARYGEAATEIGYLAAQEVRIDVVKGIAQPCRIDVELATGPASHILDFSELRASGERVLLDAKRSWADFRTEDGRKQTFLGRLAAEVLGYGYEHIVLSGPGDEVRVSNIDEIQAYRFMHVPDHLAALASRALSRGPMSLGALGDLLHPVNGRGMVYALMVRRLVEIDLESRLSPRSECRAVPPLPVAMPSLRR